MFIYPNQDAPDWEWEIYNYDRRQKRTKQAEFERSLITIDSNQFDDIIPTIQKDTRVRLCDENYYSYDQQTGPGNGEAGDE